MQRDNLHFNWRKVDGYNRTWNFAISEREAGKSVSTWLKIWSNFHYKNSPTIVLRRRIADLTEQYISDTESLLNKFLDNKVQLLYMKGDIKSGIVDVKLGEADKNYSALQIKKLPLFFRVIGLSIPMNRIKSLMLSNVGIIFFDEFIANIRGGEKYLDIEAFRIKEIYTTYNREATTPIKIYCCGNPYSVYNPLFSDLGVDTRKVHPGAFLVGANYVIDCFRIPDALKERILAANPLYQFDNAYAKYAFDGNAISDSNIRICKINPKGFKLRFVFKVDREYISVHSGAPIDYEGEKLSFWICKHNEDWLDKVSKNRKIYCFNFADLMQHAVIANRDKDLIAQFLSFKSAVQRREAAYNCVDAEYITEDIYQFIQEDKMSTSKITLYKSAITPSRNFRVDELDTYLNSCPKIEFNKLQYQKLNLNMYIKLPLAQELISNPQYNYARLEQDNKEFYFFIMRADWIARKTIKFALSMDTINTYWSAVKWSAQTTIIREHRDRYYPHADIMDTSSKYQRAIDRYQEGLNPAKDRFNYQKMRAAYYEDENQPAYLVWLSNAEITPEKQSANPIITGYCFEDELKIKNEVDYGSDTINDTIKKLQSITGTKTGHFYLTTSYAYRSKGYRCGIKINNVPIDTATLFATDTSNSSTLRCIHLKITKSIANVYTAEIESLFYTGDVYPYSFIQKKKLPDVYDITEIEIEGNIDLMTYAESTNEYYNNLSSLDIIDNLSTLNVHSGLIPAQYATSFADLDRSNTRIVKILKLPAPPLNTKKLIPGYNLIRCADKMYQNLDSNYLLTDTIKQCCYIKLTPTAHDTPNVVYESKLYSSEFYDLRLQFIDNSYTFRLENAKEGFKSIIYPQFEVSQSLSSNCRIKLNNYEEDFDEQIKDEGH